MPEEWKTLSQKKVHQNPWFEVFEVDLQRPDGSQTKYYTTQDGGAVFILAVKDGKILVEKQFRYPMGRKVSQLPAGGIDGQDFLTAAKRELKEETGYTAEKWTRLAAYHPSPTKSSVIYEVYLAEGLQPGKPALEPGELDMECGFYSLHEIDSMVESGELVGSSNLACLYLYKMYLEKHK
jgi:ADP-ribose pyrophosphatase